MYICIYLYISNSLGRPASFIIGPGWGALAGDPKPAEAARQ